MDNRAYEILKYIAEEDGEVNVLTLPESITVLFETMVDITDECYRYKQKGWLQKSEQYWYSLTPAGRTALNGKAVELQQESERQKLEFKKLSFEVKNMERIYKTYWWTFGLSILAVIISIVALIKK